MSDHWTALAGLGENMRGHGLGLTLDFSAVNHRSFSSLSRQQDEFESEQESSDIHPSLILKIPHEKHYRQIIRENKSCSILNTHADQEIQAYLALSDEELNAIIQLRRIARSAGKHY